MARVRRALAVAGLALTLALGSADGRSGASRAGDSPSGPSLPTLRVVTFNLLHAGIFSELTGDDAALEERLRLVVDGLRALDADVIGLQEASVGRRRGHVATRLADALGYRYVFAPAATRPLGSESLRRAVRAVLGFAEGPVLLSRFPIVRWQAWELPDCGRAFDTRVLLFAELATPTGRIAAYSAHTSGDACHARAVAGLVRASAGALPAVVMGDFNATATSSAVRLLTVDAGFIDAFAVARPGSAGFTDGQDVRASVRTARQRIDYVFLAPGRSSDVRVVESRVVLDRPVGAGAVRWPSDHYGVLAEIALGSGGALTPRGSPGRR